MPITLLAQAAGQPGLPPEIPAGAVAAIIAFLAVAVVIGLLIGALVAWLIYKPYSKLPREHQTLAPGLCFLLMVPVANLVMPIILGIKLPEAFASYFDATDQSHETGDAGKAVGLWWGISTLACIVPLVGIVAGLASLVLLIIFIIKLWEMAKRIEMDGGMGGGDMVTPGGPTF